MAEKKQYRIPLVWSVYGHLWVEAESEDEAKEIALDAETPLPEGDYIEDSLEIDNDVEIEVKGS